MKEQPDPELKPDLDLNLDLDIQADEYLYDRPIHITEAEPGMILSDDVLNSEGSIFVKKGVKLTRSVIEKIRMNKTENLLIKSKEPYDFAKHNLHTDVAVSIEKLPEFREFSKGYETAGIEAKKIIMAIGDGAEIKLEELFKLTDGIMSKLSSKSNVLTFLATLKSADEHTFTHSNNVALLCNLFASWLHMNETDTLHLTTAGILHDVGKTKIPPEVLNKKSKLTNEEFDIIKTHTTRGYRVLESQDIPKKIKLSALSHHEKINGKGYPLGLNSDKIDSFAKIVSICDIYDAMTANRVYRPKLCPFEVIRTFERNVYGELDTEYLLIFLRNIASTYLGVPVRLSDNRTGTVVFINNMNLSKPIVKLTNGEMLDLSHISELTITEII